MEESIQIGKKYMEVLIEARTPRTVDDFNRYSGTTIDKALSFLKELIDETDFSGRAILFYSGYAGFSLLDSEGEPYGVLFYEGNRYGLEDAIQGRGWYFGRGSFSTRANPVTIDIIGRTIKELSGKNEYRTSPVRM